MCWYYAEVGGGGGAHVALTPPRPAADSHGGLGRLVSGLPVSLDAKAIVLLLASPITVARRAGQGRLNYCKQCKLTSGAMWRST